MKFDRIKLSNFRCYSDVDVEFDEGVIVVHGINGSGKSSLLKAVFFALYGSNSLDSDTTLDEVITNGADESMVKLWFSHGGKQYTIERGVRERNGSATNNKSILRSGDGTLVEGATDVTEYVSELLRMDSGSFVNCAYIQQGEVEKLISASSTERQNMIDDLLQLGELEDFRERASKVRIGVGRVHDTKEGSAEKLKSQIEEKEEENFPDKLASVKSDIADVEAEISELEERRDSKQTERDEAQELIDEHESKQQRLDELTNEIESLEKKIENDEERQKELADAIQETKETATSLRESISNSISNSRIDGEALSDLDTSSGLRNIEVVATAISDAEAEVAELASDVEDKRVECNNAELEADVHSDDAETAETRAEEKREDASDTETKAKDIQNEIDEIDEKITAAKTTISEEKNEFSGTGISEGNANTEVSRIENELEDVRGNIQSVTGKIEGAKQHIEQGEKLEEEGKCPECGQPVDESPHVESIEEEREKVSELQNELGDLNQSQSNLKDELETARRLVDAEKEIQRQEERIDDLQLRREKKVDQKKEAEANVKTHLEKADEFDEKASEHRQKASEYREKSEKLREEAEEIESKHKAKKDEVSDLRSLESELGDLAEANSEIERKAETKTQLNSQNEERNERAEVLREEIEEIKSDYDDDCIEEAHEVINTVESRLEELDEDISDKKDVKDSLQSRKGGIENTIEDLESKREEYTEIKENVERLDSLYNEMEDVQQMYVNLRSELRAKNVAHLERILNDIFQLLYRNESYGSIDLDNDYGIVVNEKTGSGMQPTQLSGGEKVLFNLSLRCAIYKLLAEGISGNAAIPPLILDEPTAHLDSGHVGRISEVIELMRDLGVPQTIVVSHNSEIMDSADQNIEVVQDSSTNRSSIKEEGVGLEI